MSDWVHLCTEAEAPAPGSVAQFDAAGVAVCLANVAGTLHALDNWCPHRRGPLGEGWLEGAAVICPWHCWGFDVHTGALQAPESGKIAVFPVMMGGGAVLVKLE